MRSITLILLLFSFQVLLAQDSFSPTKVNENEMHAGEAGIDQGLYPVRLCPPDEGFRPRYEHLDAGRQNPVPGRCG